MTTRLPQTGKDSGIWGDLLNKYLLTEHNHDGTHKIATLLHTPATEGKVLVSNPHMSNGSGWRTLSAQDVGLHNVDNTADADKPVSTAVHNALQAKENLLPSGTTAQFLRGDKLWHNLDRSVMYAPATLVIRPQGSNQHADAFTTGVADQSAINSAISATTASVNQTITVKLVGAFHITGPIVLHSHMILDAREATITLAPGTGNKNMVTNQQTGSNRSFGGASTTAGSATVTAGGAGFSAADVGSTIKITGAGPGGLTLVTTIASVQSGSQATLGHSAFTTASGTATIYRRDSHIEVAGGYWDRGSNGGAESSDSHSFFFRHVDGLTIRDIRFNSSAAKYAINPGDVTDVLIQNIMFDAHSDGVHVTGPAQRVIVQDIKGTTGDDMVAFTCSDYGQFNDTNGSITDVVVRNICTNGSLCALKATGKNGELLARMTVSDITGTTTQSGIRFWNDPAIGDLAMRQIHLSHINIRPGATHEVLQCNVYELDDLTISDSTYDATGQTGDFRGVRMFFFSHPYSGAANAHISEVSITNCKMLGNATGSFILLENNIGIDTLNVVGCKAAGESLSFIGQVGTPAATVTNRYITSCQLLSGGNVSVPDTGAANAMLLNGDQTVGGSKTYTGTSIHQNALTLQYAAPKLTWYESDGSADSKRWDILADTGRLNFRLGNDADSSANNWMYVDRTGTSATQVVINPSLTVGSSLSTSFAGVNHFLAIDTQTPSNASGAGIQGRLSGTPTAAGQRLGFYLSGASGANTAGMVAWTKEAWTGSARGSFLAWETVAAGSTTRTERMRLDEAELRLTTDLTLNSAGNGLRIKEGTNARLGVVTLAAGTATVPTAAVTTNSRIILTVQSLGTVSLPQPVGVTARTPGTSFTIRSGSASDTSVVAWQIIEPA